LYCTGGLSVVRGERADIVDSVSVVVVLYRWTICCTRRESRYCRQRVGCRCTVQVDYLLYEAREPILLTACRLSLYCTGGLSVVRGERADIVDSVSVVVVLYRWTICCTRWESRYCRQRAGCRCTVQVDYLLYEVREPILLTACWLSLYCVGGLSVVRGERADIVDSVLVVIVLCRWTICCTRRESRYCWQRAGWRSALVSSLRCDLTWTYTSDFRRSVIDSTRWCETDDVVVASDELSKVCLISSRHWTEVTFVITLWNLHFFSQRFCFSVSAWRSLI